MRHGSEYREEPCRSALNRVKGMPFDWSLNPYMGCVHRCTFCYVRAFERRADRPVGRPLRHARSASRSTSPRCCAASSPGRRGSASASRSAPPPTRTSRPRAATGSPARASRRSREARNPFGIITRGPMIVRDVDVLVEAARRAERLGHLLGPDARRGRLAHDRAGDGAAAPAAPGARASSSTRGSRPASAWRPILPGISDRPEQLERRRPRRARGRRDGVWANLLYLRPGTREHFLERARRATGPSSSPATSDLYAEPRVPPGSTRRSRSATQVAELAREHGIRDRRARPARAAAASRSSLHSRSDRPIQSAGRARTRHEPTEIRDHLPDRRRPRGRPRRAPALALARAAHPRDRRGVRRRERGRPRRAAQARRRDHGRPHARHGRARGDEAAQREGARHGRPHLHRVQRAQPARPRPRVGREGLHPQGGAAPDAAAGDREGRRRRGLRRPGADARVPARQGARTC